MVFEDFSSKEELLKILPLKGHTRGEDIYANFKEYIVKEDISLRKMTAITTDGAPAMKGKNNGFISLCKKDPLFPNFKAYHCFIHQEVLCIKILKFEHVINPVTKIINSIRSLPIQHRLFKMFLQNDDDHEH